MKALAKEASMLSRLHHPHVLGCFGVMHWGRVLAVVTEFAAWGNLRMYLRVNKSRLGLRGVVSIASQLVDAEQYLIEQCGVLHRNLITPAVLVFSSGDAQDSTDILAKL